MLFYFIYLFQTFSALERAARFFFLSLSLSRYFPNLVISVGAILIKNKIEKRTQKARWNVLIAHAEIQLIQTPCANRANGGERALAGRKKNTSDKISLCTLQQIEKRLLKLQFK